MPKGDKSRVVAVAVGPEPVSPRRVRSVEKDFKQMRASVQGPDYTPYSRVEGYICKVGEENDNTRYFVLNNHYLSYWDSQKHCHSDAHPLATFDLRQIKGMWFDQEEFDIVFKFNDGSTRILHFETDAVEALMKWYQEIDKRIRYFRSLGDSADAEASLDAMRAAAVAQGLPVAPTKEKHKPANVRNLKTNAQHLGVRRATLAVPAAPLIKRFGYRKSVVQQDQTPYPRVQGYLTKYGDRKYYQLNNEYMNYWKDKDAWQKGKAPLGSYNIIHFECVRQDDVNIWIQFVDGGVRHLVAPNSGIARQWGQFIELRRRWFVDVHSARESAEKVREKEARGETVRRKTIDAMITNVRAKAPTAPPVPPVRTK